MKQPKKVPSAKRPSWAKGHEWSQWAVAGSAMYQMNPNGVDYVKIEKGVGAPFNLVISDVPLDTAVIRMGSAEDARELAMKYLEIMARRTGSSG